ncbi:hypothetical protein F4861DRAFT_312329 [Xylaria intraflava]|nr:hypothetical protein F4861DRAFT_312329 [Xylaria intraflava]
MPTKHRIKVQVPIPQEVSPADVVATLQSFEPLLRNHRYIADYHPIFGPMRSRDLAVIKRDPLFRHDCDDLAPQSVAAGTAPASRNSRWWVCDVWEDVYWVPFVLPYFSRLKRYLAIGCKTASGIRFRQSVAGGVTTRGTFTVISRRTGCAYGANGGDDRNVARNSWEEDTEKGSMTFDSMNEKVSENGAGGGTSRRSADDEKGSMTWGEESDTESEAESAPAESAWDILCECEIEVPLIISVPQLLMRNANRKLCEHLCKSVIHTSLTQWNQYWFTT